jgi:opacity protein-like surface antigen
MKYLAMVIIGMAFVVSAHAEGDGIAGRLQVGVSNSGSSPAEKNELNRGSGEAVAAIYGISRNVGLDLTLGSVLYGTKDKFFRDGTVSVGTYMLGARYVWRTDKRFLPYIRAGVGLSTIHHKENDGARVWDIVYGRDYSYDFKNAWGMYEGGGFTWFLTSNRKWSLGMDIRFFSARAEAKQTLAYSGGSAPTVTSKTFNFGGSVTGIDLSYSFF